jgi:nucleotide-binding universal stress UspA family protein
MSSFNHGDHASARGPGPRSFRIRRILLASDLGQKSTHLLEVAVDLAAALNASLEIVHVDDPMAAIFEQEPPMIDTRLRLVTPPGSEARAERIDRQLSAQAQLARDRGVICITTSLAGQPAAEVVAHMRKIAVDLVVVGVERWRFEEASREPVGFSVARRAPTPTLLVPL